MEELLSGKGNIAAVQQVLQSLEWNTVFGAELLEVLIDVIGRRSGAALCSW